MSRLWSILLSLLAAATPPLAAYVVWLSGAAERHEMLSVGMISGLLVGQIVALKSGRLRALFLGPVFGFLAGYADLRTLLWLFERGCPLSVGAMVPVWGFILGFWAALSRKSWVARLLVLLTVTSADFLARWGWSLLLGWSTTASLADNSWRWLIESFVYLPPALTAVLLTAHVNRPVATAAVAPQ